MLFFFLPAYCLLGPSLKQKRQKLKCIKCFLKNNVFLKYATNTFYYLYIKLFFYSFKNFYCYLVTVVRIFSLSLCPTPVKPTSLPHLHPPPWFCPCVCYSSSCKPLSPLSSPHSPLAIVTLFLTSMSLVILLAFSFVDYVPVKGEIIWYLSLTTWLISLSIMLSSSIHAVA